MDKVPIDVMKPITGRKSRRAPDLAHSWILIAPDLNRTLEPVLPTAKT
jgi:hypothetical protein